MEGFLGVLFFALFVSGAVLLALYIVLRWLGLPEDRN